MKMDKRAIVTSVEIINGNNRVILNKSELKRFVDKRVQLKVAIVNDCLQPSCRVALDRLSPTFIHDALSGNIASSVQKDEIKSNVRFFHKYMFKRVRFMQLVFFCSFDY